MSCSLSLSSSVQKDGDFASTSQQSSSFNCPGCGHWGRTDTRVLLASVGRGQGSQGLVAIQGPGSGWGGGGAVLTGDVQVGVGLDLPARVAGQALEDPRVLWTQLPDA